MRDRQMPRYLVQLLTRMYVKERTTQTPKRQHNTVSLRHGRSIPYTYQDPTDLMCLGSHSGHGLATFGLTRQSERLNTPLFARAFLVVF